MPNTFKGKFQSILDNLSTPNNNVILVDSGIGNDNNSGTNNWNNALATLDAAIAKCTADNGDKILIAPGHSETYTTTGTKLTIDVAGIEIIPLGIVTFSFGHTGTTMLCSADKVKISNEKGIIRFVTAVDSVVTYMTISGSDCEINVETQDVTDKEVISDLTVTGDRCKINIRKFGYVDGNANARVVSLNAADNAEINIYALTKVTTGIVNFVSNASVGVKIKGMFYVKGTTDLTKNVVDTAGGSVFYIEGFDMGAGASFSGNTATPAVDDVGAVATAITATNSYIKVEADANMSYMKVQSDADRSYQLINADEDQSYMKVVTDADMSYTKVYGDRVESFMVVEADEVQSYVKVEVDADMSYTKVYGDRIESYTKVEADAAMSYTKVEADATRSYQLINADEDQSYMKVTTDADMSYTKVYGDRVESFMVVQADEVQSYVKVEADADMSYIKVYGDRIESYTKVEADADMSYMKVESDATMSYILLQTSYLMSMILLLPST